MRAATEPLLETMLRRLTQDLASDALVLCADGDDRPDLIVVDRTYGLVAIDVDVTEHDPAAREPFVRLNRKISDLRLEAPILERFRPHRLVLFGGCSEPLAGPSHGERPRALGLADVEDGTWLARLEPRPPEPDDLASLRSALAPTLTFDVRSRRGAFDPGRGSGIGGGSSWMPGRPLLPRSLWTTCSCSPARRVAARRWSWPGEHGIWPPSIPTGASCSCASTMRWCHLASPRRGAPERRGHDVRQVLPRHEASNRPR